MDFERVLRTFIGFFDEQGIRYVVIGGLAVHAYGRLRPTKDADFGVDLDNQRRVIAFAESVGYETINDSRAFSNHVHADPTMGRVDFMYFDEMTAAKIFAVASENRLIEGISARVAAPGHLAMMKALSMKNFPQRALYEGDDVRVLLEVPGVNVAEVREYYERQGLLGLFDAIRKAR